jgi:hypothetical protein
MDISGYCHALATLIPLPLKQKPGWARVPVWAFWRSEKSFVPTRISTPDHPDSGIDAILTTLPQPQNFTKEQAMKAQPWQPYPLERNLIPTIQETGWAPGPIWSGAINLVPRMGFNPQTLQSVARRYTRYAGLADKTLKIRYTEHIRHTRSNHPQVACAVGLHVMNMALLMKCSGQNPSQKDKG